MYKGDSILDSSIGYIPYEGASKPMCEHKNCTFMSGGGDSLVGNYVCNDCGFAIDPIVFHFVNREPHIGLHTGLHTGLQPIGPFTDHKQQRSYLAYCIDKYFETWRKASYQPPHWDHQPTPEELVGEKKYQDECENNWWLKEQYAKIIRSMLGQKVSTNEEAANFVSGLSEDHKQHLMMSLAEHFDREVTDRDGKVVTYYLATK